MEIISERLMNRIEWAYRVVSHWVELQADSIYLMQVVSTTEVKVSIPNINYLVSQFGNEIDGYHKLLLSELL